MAEFRDYKEYQLYMDNNYNEEEQITIENFISYYMNKHRGFGRQNCEYEYQEELQNDVTGKLHDFAIIGFNILKNKIINKKRSNVKVKK
jgi:hypothetical protein